MEPLQALALLVPCLLAQLQEIQQIQEIPQMVPQLAMLLVRDRRQTLVVVSFSPSDRVYHYLRLMTSQANNAGAAGTVAANGLPQLPNPGPNLPVPTSFTPVSQAVSGATTARKIANQQAIAALQAAADNWSFDTGMVSNNQNTGKALANNAAKFQAQANIAYNAEVDELTHKAILDQIIGNDPDVSIANQTLTNGCFQSGKCR